MDSKGSRINEARRRLRTARRSTGVAAGIAFLGIAMAARAAHPGTSHQASTSNSATASTSSSASSDDTFFDDSGATFSQTQSSTAQVQSGGS